MKKNELLKNANGEIVRVLEIINEKILFIPCLQKSMPAWDNISDFADYESCTEAEMHEAVNVTLPDFENLSADDPAHCSRTLHTHRRDSSFRWRC